jgi:hypothetical protein
MGKEAKDVVKEFKGQGYLQWRKNVQMFLTLHGLEHYMEPPQQQTPQTPPTAAASSAPITIATPAAKGKDKEVEEIGASGKGKKEKWTQKQVLSQLYFCVALQYRSLVEEAPSVHILFDRLDNSFLAVDRMRAVTLKQKARSFEMDINKPMLDQFMRYESLLNDLREIGATFTQEEMRENILQIIPKPHLTHILNFTTFNSQNINALTYQQIKNMVIIRGEQKEAYEEKKPIKKQEREEDFSLYTTTTTEERPYRGRGRGRGGRGRGRGGRGGGDNRNDSRNDNRNDNRHTSSDNYNKESSDNNTKNDNNNSKKEYNNREPFICHKCGKEGHKKSNCPTNSNEEKDVARALAEKRLFKAQMDLKALGVKKEGGGGGGGGGKPKEQGAAWF